MSSFHSTVTVLMKILVRDILRAVRESSLQELVLAASSANRQRPPAPQTQRPPRRRPARAKEVPKGGASKESAHHPRRALTKAKPSAVLTPSAMEDLRTEDGDAQITDPDALLRETAVTIPAPRPSAAHESVMADTVEPMTTSALREWLR